MVYVGVAGVPALLAWDEPITREALALLHACLAEHVRTWGGYLVEAADEQVGAGVCGRGGGRGGGRVWGGDGERLWAVGVCVSRVWGRGEGAGGFVSTIPSKKP